MKTRKFLSIFLSLSLSMLLVFGNVFQSAAEDIKPAIRGDVDSDSAVTLKDAILIQKRLARANEEMQLSELYNYVVVNDTVQECADRIEDIFKKETSN